jgi:Phospholipase B
MLRIFKEYKINLNNPLVVSNQMILTARPGDLESKDDYYLLSNNLVVMETSLNNYNVSNYGFFHYDSLPCWMRVLLANRLAQNGSSWSQYFLSYRSGTHNNQWLVVDYNQYNNSKSSISTSSNIGNSLIND